jgi:hypothetical protein
MPKKRLSQSGVWGQFANFHQASTIKKVVQLEKEKIVIILIKWILKIKGLTLIGFLV